MSQTTTAQLTLQEIEALPNTHKAHTQAEAYTITAKELPEGDGPIASKKLFVDKATAKLVYEFYRARNKERKVYIIF